MNNLKKDLRDGIFEVSKNFREQKMKDFIELEYVIRLKVPPDFLGVDPWGKIASLEDFMDHWLKEGHYIEDGFVTLPRGIHIESSECRAYPKEWWKELMKDAYDKEEPNLIKNKLIL